MYPCNASFGAWKFLFHEELRGFLLLWVTPFRVNVRPRKSTYFDPKWQLAMDSFSPAF